MIMAASACWRESKILNNLLSPVSVSKIHVEEECNTSQSQDRDSQDGNVFGTRTLQYKNADLSGGVIQISVNVDGIPMAHGLQTLTRTNVSPSSTDSMGATVVQYAQILNGQQFHIPDSFMNSLLEDIPRSPAPVYALV